MTSKILVFFALMITAQPALADCPAFLMTPRIQTAARKIIESFKETPPDYSGRTTQEYKEYLYQLVLDKLLSEITSTRDPNYEAIDRVFNDPKTAYVCFPDFGPLIQLAKESYESNVRKKESDAAEAKGPIGQLRQTYLVFITLQRCGANEDYSGPLVTKPDLERAKEATRRAESRLAPQLDQGLASTQVWDQALALPPLQGGMSRFRCVQLLSALLGANPTPLLIEKP